MRLGDYISRHLENEQAGPEAKKLRQRLEEEVQSEEDCGILNKLFDSLMKGGEKGGKGGKK